MTQRKSSYPETLFSYLYATVPKDCPQIYCKAQEEPQDVSSPDDPPSTTIQFGVDALNKVILMSFDKPINCLVIKESDLDRLINNLKRVKEILKEG